ncbi:hypothetical protein LJC53_05530 [Bacteroidales bacterium OttesenSCG-928-C03]|nr:hypothetical protein [Bacteroidales bacterium OttesenSCG-928-C03]MDL2326747.1 hypothetical protein [Bacteroidales bacterium OttesenSCG-928-A14]
MSKKAFSNITPQKAIAISIIVILFVALFFIFKNQIKNMINNMALRRDANSALNEEIAMTGQSPSYTESQYKAYATRLYNAMKGWGTNESAIYAVFNEMNNTADVLKLISVYGVKDDETLPEWLHGDLSILEINKLNKILSGKGINYQF